MKRIKLIWIILIVFCLAGVVSSVQAQTCKSLTFKGGSISPTTVSTGGSYTMSCDYGAVVDCVTITPPSGSCVWTGFEGTAAKFSCIAGTSTGTFTGCCKTFSTPTNCCPYQNSAGSLTVQANSQPLAISDTLDSQYDVIVVGAGTGGVSAAMQAARMGAKVALLEETDWIGGQMNAAAVTSMDEDRQAAPQDVRDRGIYKEFIEKIKAYYSSRGKSVGTCSWSNDSVSFEPNVGQQMLWEMIKETRGRTLPNGSRPILHLSLRTTIINTLLSDDQKTVTGVTVNIVKPTGTIQNVIQAKIIIDATEYGDVLPLTPARYRVGNYITSKNQNILGNVYIQDITYTAVIKKYLNLGNLNITNPPSPKEGYTPIGYLNFPNYLNYDYLKNKFAGIVFNNGEPRWTGKYPVSWPVHNGYRGQPDSSNPLNYTAENISSELQKISKTQVNWANDYPAITPYVPDNPDGFPEAKLSVRYLEDLAYRKKANCEAKLKTLQFIYYAQHEPNIADPYMKSWSLDNSAGFDTPYQADNLCNDVIPADYKVIEKFFPVIPYVRESRRVVGLHTLTGFEIKRDFLTHKAITNFPTALALGDYGMDLHNAKDSSDLEIDTGDASLTIQDRQTGGPFQVPFECFVPEMVDGLLAAEKNISVSRLTGGATRLQPITMLTGQAAGAIAAVAIRQNLQPRYIDPIVVQIELLKAGSNLALTEYTDVPKSHSFWPYIQLATIRKIFSGYGDGRFGPDDLITRDQAAVTIVKTFGIIPLQPTTPTFIDVPSSYWAYSYIEAAYKAGIMQGCSVNPNQFCPTGYITRAQYAKMLITALNINTIGADERTIFADVPVTYPEFKYIQLMYQLKLSSGCSFDGTNRYFCPNYYVNRGQAATFLMLGSILKGNKTDFLIPLTPIVSDEGQNTSSTNQLYASWTASDPESGISEYQYKITQDSITGAVVRGWTSTGATPYVTAGGLTLTSSKVYYFAVKAKNNAGLWSAIGYSNGITVDIAVPAITNKTLTPQKINQALLFQSQVVDSISGVKSATLMIQDPLGRYTSYAMSYDPLTGLYKATQPAKTAPTTITYKIKAVDNAGNTTTTVAYTLNVVQ